MNYQELKLISSRELEAENYRPSRESWLSRARRSLIAAFSQQELQVWQKSDRTGNTWWKLYHPTTGEILRFDSEAEVRTWIEESYYHPVKATRSFKPYAWQQIER